MSDAPYVGQNVKTFNSSPEFDGFSKVVIVVTDELEYSAGTDTGRTLTMICPWGTQAMADNILADIRGYKYHPYSATGAFLDPSSEIGDGVTVNGIYSGIYTMDVNFGGECRADISAPAEEEIDHEYPYVSRQERTITRKFAQVESEFKVQQGLISAKVSKTGGSNDSFGWELDEKSWTLKSKGKDVLKAYEGGVTITGKIFAEEGGRIGGFDIMSDYLSYNKQTWMGTNTLGAYIGINGIQLGKNFRVDMAGNLYAESGEFSGTVKAGKIQYGEGKGGFLDGEAISVGTISAGERGQLSKGVNQSLGYANFANDVFSGYKYCNHLGARKMHLGDYDMGWTTINYIDHNGNKRTLRVISGQ